jgi:hypothetical protein
MDVTHCCLHKVHVCVLHIVRERRSYEGWGFTPKVYQTQIDLIDDVSMITLFRSLDTDRMDRVMDKALTPCKSADMVPRILTVLWVSLQAQMNPTKLLSSSFVLDIINVGSRKK